MDYYLDITMRNRINKKNLRIFFEKYNQYKETHIDYR